MLESLSAGEAWADLLEACKFDVASAQRCVVCIDVTDPGRQQVVLQFMDRNQAPRIDGVPVDASGLLLLCGQDGPPAQMHPELARALRATIAVSPLSEPELARLIGCADMSRWLQDRTESTP